MLPHKEPVRQKERSPRKLVRTSRTGAHAIRIPEGVPLPAMLPNSNQCEILYLPGVLISRLSLGSQNTVSQVTDILAANCIFAYSLEHTISSLSMELAQES